MPVLDLEDVDTMPLRPGTDLASPVSPGSRQPRVSIIQREGGLPDTLTVSSIKFTIPKVERQILSDINFSVQSGEMLAIMGPSGAGKTTLLDVMALEAHAGISEGCVQLNGHDMSTKVFTEQCALVGSRIRCGHILRAGSTLILQSTCQLLGVLKRRQRSWSCV